MTVVVVNDASCLIDLRKGRLLRALLRLPLRFVVPLPVRESELLDFSSEDWEILEKGGMEIHDLPPGQVAEAFAFKRRFGGLSANDCFCLVAARSFGESILLTGDARLRKIAENEGVRVHGVLWVVDRLALKGVCGRPTLIKALEAWKSDRSVFLPRNLIDERLRELRKRTDRQ
ncbi:MAG: PIN domain-containing protein [Gammaproteobacteria bacterium]|nr:PIN domain-containing protein [Gammaproteobacteria bacterium]